MSIADNMLDTWLAGFAERDFERSPIGETERAMLQRCGRRIRHLHARCHVLASDVGPEHTGVPLAEYALTSGWSVLSHDSLVLRLVHTGGARSSIARTQRGDMVAVFCNDHAKATGIAPLDVLAAIGSFGES